MPRGDQREPKDRPKGAKGFQNEAQEASKSLTKRFRTESKNMQKLWEGCSKIDFGRPGNGPKGMKTREKGVEICKKRVERKVWAPGPPRRAKNNQKDRLGGLCKPSGREIWRPGLVLGYVLGVRMAGPCGSAATIFICVFPGGRAPFSSFRRT